MNEGRPQVLKHTRGGICVERALAPRPPFLARRGYLRRIGPAVREGASDSRATGASGAGAKCLATTLWRRHSSVEVKTSLTVVGSILHLRFHSLPVSLALLPSSASGPLSLSLFLTDTPGCPSQSHTTLA